MTQLSYRVTVTTYSGARTLKSADLELSDALELYHAAHQAMLDRRDPAFRHLSLQATGIGQLVWQHKLRYATRSGHAPETVLQRLPAEDRQRVTARRSIHDDAWERERLMSCFSEQYIGGADPAQF